MIDINLNHITKSYGFAPVLTGVCLEVLSGEHIAVVGGNGVGKTTLFRIITGEETADSGDVFLRKNLTFGYLEQLPPPTVPDLTAGDYLRQSFADVYACEARLSELEAAMSDADGERLDRLVNEYARVQNRFISLDGYETTEQYGRVVTGLNLSHLLDRPFAVLSGGQKTLMMLAAVLLLKPGVLLLDEPTNHLDIRALEWLEGFLSKYKGTVVIISHDRYFLDRVCDKTLLLENGVCAVYHGNYSSALRERENQLLQQFEDYKNQQKKIEAMKAAIKRYREWGARSDDKRHFIKAKDLEKRLEKMELIARPQMEPDRLPLHLSAKRAGRDMLVVEDFSLTLGDHELFAGANMQVFGREKVCLFGGNGTGKTSLIRSVLGQLGGYGGRVAINPSAQIGYIPQEIRFDDEKIGLLDAFRGEHVCDEKTARSILAKYYFFGDDVFKRVGSLSGGEKVLLKMAVLIQKGANFLLLDEPTNHIDIETRGLLEESLQEFSGTILFVSHDRYLINKLATRIVVIQDRQMVSFDGNYDQYKRYTDNYGSIT